MPGFDHVSSASKEVASPRRTRLGLVLFTVYLILYAGFVALNALAPDRMSWTPWAGVNLAVLYGLGLIFAAFALSLLYELLCRRFDRADARHDREAA